MDRKTFLKAMAALPLAGSFGNLSSLEKAAASMPGTDTMPVMFVGHGSPMNAIEHNQFSQGMKDMAMRVGTPAAILMVSAHWETRGTFVTAMEHPKTIHDFGGFPQALFDVQYPAPGSKWLASETQKSINATAVAFDSEWGLDHGAWSVAINMFPDATVPIVQLSLDYSLTPAQHFAIAQQLKGLRKKGVLIIGSGNMIHNLGMLSFKNNDMNSPFAYDWAAELNTKLKQHISDNNVQPLINYSQFGKAAALAIPTPEHYLPMLYTLAVRDSKDNLEYFNDVAVAGSISMTSFLLG